MVIFVNLKLQETKGSRKIPSDAISVIRKCDVQKSVAVDVNLSGKERGLELSRPIFLSDK